MLNTIGENTTRIADIGTDHGLAAIALALDGSFTRIIATEKNHKPLDKAVQNAKLHKVAHLIDFRLGDGLTVLEPGEAEVIVINGLGGVLMTELLEACPQVAQTSRQIILQPIQAAPQLRRYLLSHGYHIREERLAVEKDHVYEIISTGYEPEWPTGFIAPHEMETGISIRQQPSDLAVPFLEKLLRHWQKKAGGLAKSDRCDTKEAARAQEIRNGIEEELKWHQQQR